MRFLAARLLGQHPPVEARRRPPQEPGRRPDAIVLCLDPALFPGTTQLAMNGWARKTGEVRPVNLGWGSIPLPFFAKRTAKLLDDEIRQALGDTDGMVYVEGWSEGAGAAYIWLRQHGGLTEDGEPKSDIPPGRVAFVCLGNPERAHGGACVVPKPPRKLFGFLKPSASYGGCGISADNRYIVIEAARQRDGWADCATAENPSREALDYPDDAYHMDYFSVDPHDPDALVCTEGKVTYLLWLSPMRNAEKQARIEAEFYDRPDYQPQGDKPCLP